MAADDTDFGTEMRGYKKDEVDRAIQQLRGEHHGRPNRVLRFCRIRAPPWIKQ